MSMVTPSQIKGLNKFGSYPNMNFGKLANVAKTNPVKDSGCLKLLLEDMQNFVPSFHDCDWRQQHNTRFGNNHNEKHKSMLDTAIN